MLIAMLSVNVTLETEYGWRSGNENGEGIMKTVAQNISKIPRKSLPYREEK